MGSNIDTSPSQPLFSIIIPLEYHRGQWEQCWDGWNTQTVARSLYEIILVVPPDFQQLALLDQLSADRVELSEYSHDIGLCKAGAAKAQGKYLFFTEAHCWPEPNVLEKCLQAFRDNPAWAGFSCQSMPITRNRLSKAEAEMYVADIEYAMHVHPWRRILDHCFMTTRDAYEACDGFRPELGHYAEWVLAANYFQHGYELGYFPEARFHHYYAGSLKELKTFTLDFVAGEIRYFSEIPAQSDTLLEPPTEWTCQGNFDRDTARSILGIAVKSLWPPQSYRHFPSSLGKVLHWVVPVIFGDWIARGCAAVMLAWARIALLLANFIGSDDQLNARFKEYIAALIATGRLTIIGRLRRKLRATTQQVPAIKPDVLAPDNTGFYPLEQFEGSRFRWSDTAAAMLISVPAGAQKIIVDCIPVRDLTSRICDVRFYLDGTRVAHNQLTSEKNRVSITLNRELPRTLMLSWTCLPLVAPADSRRLGLAIKHIELA